MERMNIWQTKISKLEAYGFTLSGIARAIGIEPQSVSDIKHGRTKEPRGMAAVKLYQLRPDIFGTPPTNHRQEVPDAA
ncbi:helix-turn-helix domain-containing protein [Xylella fastidiosa subsp. multiplex]|nr:helix-turn-helix domain-containing protein [Xylella fastidiosa subsp. multiplex]